MLQFFRKTRYQYSPVNGGSRIRTHYSRHIFLVTAAFVLASAITGFYAGRLSIHNRPYPPIDCKSLVWLSFCVEKLTRFKYPFERLSFTTAALSAQPRRMFLMQLGSLYSPSKAVSSNTLPSHHNVRPGQYSTSYIVSFVFPPHSRAPCLNPPFYTCSN